MKRTGKCPKCGGTEIYCDKTVSKDALRGTITVTAMKTAKIINYICLSCGYIERYLEKPDAKLNEKIRSKWAMWGA